MTKLPTEEKITALVEAYRGGDFAAAERMARGFTRKWPGFDLGWNILSAALHARGKLEPAAQAYRKAIALTPDYAELHGNFGALRLQQGRIEEAEKAFRISIELDPRSSQGHSNLAMAQLLSGAYEPAAASSRAALEIDPANAAAANTLGNALKALGRLDEAVQAYRSALAVNPAYAKAHSNLAGVPGCGPCLARVRRTLPESHPERPGVRAGVLRARQPPGQARAAGGGGTGLSRRDRRPARLRRSTPLPRVDQDFRGGGSGSRAPQAGVLRARARRRRARAAPLRGRQGAPRSRGGPCRGGVSSLVPGGGVSPAGIPLRRGGR